MIRQTFKEPVFSKIRKRLHLIQCYKTCPYYRNTMDGMECGHILFRIIGFPSGMIITNQNSIGRFPDKCPLIIVRLFKILNKIILKGLHKKNKI
jgi:hypothetical protein